MSETLMASRPDILNHNIETVRRLTPRVRARATYDRTLEFLRRSKELQPDIPTKSSLMVGLGETMEEIYETMDDLRANDVDILTIGQYLQPSRKHLKVEKYYTPLEFGKMRKVAMDKGFKHCQAYETMDDLRANDVDILTIGQYLQPSRKHLKVEKYYTPLEFGKMRKVAMDKGFKHCQAGPLVRSSYHADEQVNEAAKERQRQGEEQLSK